MSTTLQPRKVEKPYLLRWLRSTCALFGRSPIRFGLVVALLGSLDTAVSKLAEGYTVERRWAEWLGILLLPLVWSTVSAVARGADDAAQTWPALSALGRRRVWLGSLGAGAVFAGLIWFFGWILVAGHAWGVAGEKPYLQNPGQFIDSLAVGIVLIGASLGQCFYPLLVLVPGMTPMLARDLSHKAILMNDRLVTPVFVGALAIGANVLATLLPAWGMTMAACLVFIGVLNYVAYRDIFECRSGNLPKAVMEAREPVPGEQRN